MIEYGPRDPRRSDQARRAWLPAAVLIAAAAICTPALADEAKPGDRAPNAWPAPLMLAQAGGAMAPALPSALRQLIGEALRHNPDIAAASHEKDAARHRVSPAGALEDPMFEAGLVNMPISPWRLNREDMTMKMLGISQRLPYPGKRGLREAVAAKDAESVALG